MAADWRTLKLEVLAETKDFVKGMDSANKQTESFGTKLVDFGKKAALALAAAGAAAQAAPPASPWLGSALQPSVVATGSGALESRCSGPDARAPGSPGDDDAAGMYQPPQ